MIYSNEQIRAAILRAADRVERDTTCYYFPETRVPACGTPGCLWGWIGHELGFKAGTAIRDVYGALGLGAEDLYRQCAVAYNLGHMKGEPHGAQRDCALLAVDGLRKFADRYYPAAAPITAVSTYISQPLVAWRDCAWAPAALRDRESAPGSTARAGEKV